MVFFCGVGVNLSFFFRSLILILVRFFDEILMMWGFMFVFLFWFNVIWDCVFCDDFCDMVFFIKNDWGWYFVDGFDSYLNLIVYCEIYFYFVDVY